MFPENRTASGAGCRTSEAIETFSNIAKAIWPDNVERCGHGLYLGADEIKETA